MPMRRPDKTELELVLLLALVGVPFAYAVIRTVFGLLGRIWN